MRCEADGPNYTRLIRSNCPVYVTELTGYGRMDLELSQQKRKPSLALGLRQEQKRENAWGAKVACLIGASALRHQGEMLHIKTIYPTLAYQVLTSYAVCWATNL